MPFPFPVFHQRTPVLHVLHAGDSESHAPGVLDLRAPWYILVGHDAFWLAFQR